MPLKDGACNDRSWYLPFVVTKQNKSRVVFDTAATYKGVALNNAVFASTNLLKQLSKRSYPIPIGKICLHG